jgi:predicted RNase H-like HicB family nuclease
MEFTAVFMKLKHGYVGYIQELPIVNSHGRTLEEARRGLRELAALVFDEERRKWRELAAGKDFVREAFFIPLRPG